MIRTFTCGISFTAIFFLSAAAIAHIEYYDLNQGAHVSDLTPAGRTASTAQYGSTPANVMALNGPPAADGIASPGLSAQSNMPLNDTALWTPTYQVTIGGGTFTGLTYTPGSSTATVDVTDINDWAWANGTKTTLGDSHKVDFFNFRLTQASNVVITWNVDTGGFYIDCAFSLYRGVLPYYAHDDAVEILNPFKVGVGKVQDPLDSGSYQDVQGILSVARNTGPGALTYLGQFNALNNWSQSSPGGHWGALQFITAVNAKTANLVTTASETSESLSILLQPGNYTIAASGALGAAGSQMSLGLSNLHGKLIYSATAATDADADGDNVADSLDNCLLMANATQMDGDQEGYGNRCDGDLNNNDATNAQDYAIFRSRLNTADAVADLNGNGAVNAQDYAIFRSLLNAPPGPSGLACAGTVPCP